MGHRDVTAKQACNCGKFSKMAVGSLFVSLLQAYFSWLDKLENGLSFGYRDLKSCSVAGEVSEYLLLLQNPAARLFEAFWLVPCVKNWVRKMCLFARRNWFFFPT